MDFEDEFDLEQSTAEPKIIIVMDSAPDALLLKELLVDSGFTDIKLSPDCHGEVASQKNTKTVVITGSSVAGLTANEYLDIICKNSTNIQGVILSGVPRSHGPYSPYPVINCANRSTLQLVEILKVFIRELYWQQ